MTNIIQIVIVIKKDNINYEYLLHGLTKSKEVLFGSALMNAPSSTPKFLNFFDKLSTTPFPSY